MIHPLSSENEIKNTLVETKSIMIVTVDLDLDKVRSIIKDTEVLKVVVVSPGNSMPFPMNVAYPVSYTHLTLPTKRIV